MWNADIETNIIQFGKENRQSELDKIREELFEKHKFLTYAINRFLEEYGDVLDSNTKASNLYNHLSEQFSIVERLFRIMRAYDKTNN